MKYLYLIRHAKSSWQNGALDDYDRPLNKRGKKDSAEMGKRLADRGISFDLIVSSSAKRVRTTAKRIAKNIGYRKKNIVFDTSLYLSEIESYRSITQAFLAQVDSLAIIGHNHTITEFAEYLTGESLVSIPTTGIVAITLPEKSTLRQAGVGSMTFFDFPKNLTKTLID